MKFRRIKRRKFISNIARYGAALPVAGAGLLACNQSSTKEESSLPAATESNKLNILILGGTSFLGPHQIAYAMDRGHSITTFTRGKTRPTVHQELFDNVNMLIGDRADDLSALENGSWDVVIDNSGHNVEWTKSTAALLKDRVDLYVYTSSTGVFYPYLDSDTRENVEILLEEPEGVTDEDMKIEYWYGVMKANSELAARKEFGDDRTIVVRPTYMIGPADKSNRFIHWPVRLSRGGDILVPGKEQDPVQYADVRDIAGWMIRLIEEKKAGTYNGVGPEAPQTMPEFVREAGGAFDVSSNYVQVDDYEFLKEHDVEHIVPWIMPEGNNYGSARINNEKALATGLTLRPPRETVRDTYDWWYSDALTDEKRNEYEQDGTVVLNREKEILQDWAERG